MVIRAAAAAQRAADLVMEPSLPGQDAGGSRDGHDAVRADDVEGELPPAVMPSP
jgi:hypothetical protein